VTSDLRADVEIWPFRACVMHPAIIIGTVRLLWTWLWAVYHVPQNVFLVNFKTPVFSLSVNLSRILPERKVHHSLDSLLGVFFNRRIISYFLYLLELIVIWHDAAGGVLVFDNGSL